MSSSIHVAALSSAKSSSEEPTIPSNAQKDWDLDLKHIFILSSSGKPIFSKNGDEQNLSTTFGLIQAIVSIIEISDDALSCIVAGDRTIVFFLRNSLYFISISSTNEPAVVLSAQLEFMYSQIVLVLTSKVQEVLRLNPSKDIRDLLGYDTTKRMHLSCSEDVTPPCVAFSAVNAFVCAEDLRRVVNISLQSCMTLSGAVLGVILHQDRLVTYSTNSSLDLELSTSDFLLLANFVGKSNSLRSNDQNWVPICLPTFNPDAYMQAYICNLRLQSGTASKHMDISLVLISTSADPEMFNALHAGRQRLEADLMLSDIPDRLMIALESQQAYLSIYAIPISCLNFFFLFRPKLNQNHLISKKKRTKPLSRDATASLPAPVQCHSFAVEDVSPSVSAPSSMSENSLNRILTEFQHLAAHLRVGSTLPEDTMQHSVTAPNGGGVESRRGDADHNGCDNNSSSASGVGHEVRRVNIMSKGPPPVPEGQECIVLYSYLESKMTVVCVSSNGSELYATFPPEVGLEDATTSAKALSESLRRNACHLFHLNDSLLT